MGGAGVLANAVAYQLAWLVAVLGAAAGAPWWGPVAASGASALRLASSRRRASVVTVLAVSVALGAAVDGALAATGVMSYGEPARTWPGPVPPAWMLGLWAGFGTTLGASARWLSGRLGLSALVGAAGGPLAYAAGARLGAMDLGAPRAGSLAVIGAAWALCLPMLVAVADRLGLGGDRPGPGAVGA